MRARTSVVVVGPIVPLVAWRYNDLAPPALLPHVQALPPAVWRLAQQPQLLHKGRDVHERVVVRLQNEPARLSQCQAVSLTCRELYSPVCRDMNILACALPKQVAVHLQSSWMGCNCKNWGTLRAGEEGCTCSPGVIVCDCMLQDEEALQQDGLVRGVSVHQHYVLVLLHLFLHERGHLLLREDEATS